MTDRQPPTRPTYYAQKLVQVLQRGAALGCFQLHGYEAMTFSEYLPEGRWVSRSLQSTFWRWAGEPRGTFAQLLREDQRAQRWMPSGRADHGKM
jgi:hypothetical protein